VHLLNLLILLEARKDMVVAGFLVRNEATVLGEGRAGARVRLSSSCLPTRSTAGGLPPRAMLGGAASRAGGAGMPRRMEAGPASPWREPDEVHKK
jgi:hypothetical protein